MLAVTTDLGLTPPPADLKSNKSTAPEDAPTDADAAVFDETLQTFQALVPEKLAGDVPAISSDASELLPEAEEATEDQTASVSPVLIEQVNGFPKQVAQMHHAPKPEEQAAVAETNSVPLVTPDSIVETDPNHDLQETPVPELDTPSQQAALKEQAAISSLAEPADPQAIPEASLPTSEGEIAPGNINLSANTNPDAEKSTDTNTNADMAPNSATPSATPSASASAEPTVTADKAFDTKSLATTPVAVDTESAQFSDSNDFDLLPQQVISENAAVAKTHAATSVATTNELAEPIGTQVKDHIISAKHSHDAGESQLEVVLDPPELGKVKIELTSKNEQLNARLVISENATLETIKESLPQLLESLSEAGVTLNDFQLESSTSDSQDQQDANTGTRDPSGIENETEDRPINTRSSVNSINILA